MCAGLNMCIAHITFLQISYVCCATKPTTVDYPHLNKPPILASLFFGGGGFSIETFMYKY